MIICAYRRRGALTLRCREEAELTVFSEGEQEPRTSQRHGQEELREIRTAKRGVPELRYAATSRYRLPGNLKRISVMRSVEIVSEFSPFAFVDEVKAREKYCLHRVFMAL
ncbi:unnamed protein product [Microthlaspi erraticum]|uniref:Uncharacterized protein n=1 Tax=Microthlaspi erraticum TaxID=1685480 RepID=A0A6D2JNA2_9BRAS|nr:unnamed protein product [Microthlaspi erraticum]